MTKRKFRMYVDEVGNSDLGSSENPNHRFLSLTGVIIDLEYVREQLHPQMETVKRRHFDSHPDDPVILHRKEILNKKPPFFALRDPEVCKSFDDEILGLLRTWEYIVCTVCIDKKRHKDSYTVWRYDPYHYCLAVLLERFVLFLKRCSAVGDVMAESRGGKEDRRLKDSFAGLWQNGTEFISDSIFQQFLTSKKLKVKPKTANVSGLQLADLLAHPSRSEILHEQNLLKRRMGAFAEKIIDIIKDKYDQDGKRVFGKKFL